MALKLEDQDLEDLTAGFADPDESDIFSGSDAKRMMAMGGGSFRAKPTYSYENGSDEDY